MASHWAKAHRGRSVQPRVDEATPLTLPNPMVLTPSRSSRHGRGASVVLCLRPGPSPGRSSSTQPRAPPWPSPTLASAAPAPRCQPSTLAPPPRCHLSLRVGRPPPRPHAHPSRVAHALASCHGARYRHGLHPPIHAGNLTALGERVFSNMHSATPNDCVSPAHSIALTLPTQRS